jgi:uncharacterized protein YndB with AHSA1/START domain
LPILSAFAGWTWPPSTRDKGGLIKDKELHTSSSITIGAPIEKVWDALTTPELIRRWFFGVETKTDWKVGSPLVHTGTWQDKPYEDKGTILRIEPPRLLVHTHWSPLSGVPDSPENYQEVTWALKEHDGNTEVTVSEVNLASEETKAISETAWTTVLNNLRGLLEG